MDDQNPYAPPDADLTPQPADVEGPWYHPVAITKLTLLYFLTFGLYLLVWFYHHWKLIKIREQSRIWPVPRAIFAIFFVHSLFRRIAATADRKGIVHSWRPDAQASWYVALTLVSYLADRLAQTTETLGPMDFVGLVCLVGIIFPLREVQKTINQINDDPLGRLNDSYSVGTVLVMILGGLLWLFGLTVMVMVLFGLQA